MTYAHMYVLGETHESSNEIYTSSVLHHSTESLQ